MFKKDTTTKMGLGLMTVLLFFCAQLSFGQTYNEEEDTNLETQKIDTATNLFSLIGVNNQTTSSRSRAIQGNEVFVRQIGSLNQVSIKTATQASDINLTQNGSFNSTNLNYTVDTAYADLVQNGNNNTIVDYVNNPRENISLELIQEGDNTYFERFGVNSITKSLKFKQTEAAPVIIVRSFK